VEGEMGGAPFILTGEISRDPELGPVFALNLEGRNLLLFRDEWTLLRADSDIAINGPWRQLAVSGQLALTDGLYRKNVAYFDILRGTDRPLPVEGLQLFSIRQEPLRHMTFDVDIVPRNPFRIDNNLVSGTLRPDLTLTGTGELPILVGAVYVDEIRVRLPTTRLEVDAGLILFTEARPNRPSIDLLAHTRMIGYDINIQVEGTLAEPVVILSSTPPLPQDDLLLLLLAGRLPENGIGRELTRAGGFNIAMYVGRGLLAEWLLNGADDESILERLQIEVGRGITRQGRETLDARLAIAEDVLSRDDALYITAERDVYDDFNVGIKIVFRFR
jgi:translocation and assembly module TamB